MRANLALESSSRVIILHSLLFVKDPGGFCDPGGFSKAKELEK